MTPFASEDFQDVVCHIESIDLVPLKENTKSRTELLKKMMVLGIEKQKISTTIAQWEVLKYEPDFIFCAKIFKQGNHLV